MVGAGVEIWFRDEPVLCARGYGKVGGAEAYWTMQRDAVVRPQARLSSAAASQ